jgi:hypothetical protein
MIEMLIKGAALVLFLVLVYIGITWALGAAGITIPPVVAGLLVGLLILAALLWLWRNRAKFGL